MENEIRVVSDDSPRLATHAPPREPGHEASLGDLFKQLAQDSSTLVKQEMALAKAEIRENMRSMIKDVALLAAGGAILLVGVLVLTAFLVALLGDLLGDEYWLGALIIGLIYAAVGAVLLMKGKNQLQQDDMRPDRTIATLKEDKRWASAEIDQVKRGITS